MSDNFFNDLVKKDPKRASEASEIIKEALGNDFDMMERIKQTDAPQFNLHLSEADKQKIASLVSNPALLKTILKNPKMKEVLRGFLSKKP